MHVKERKQRKRGKRGTRRNTEITMDTLLTTHDVSHMLQVDPSSVNNWVRSGQLKSYKTPGGHNRIEASDLCSFLRDHKMAIPAPLRLLAQRRILVVDDDAREQARWRRHLGKDNEQTELRFVDNGLDALLQVGVFRPNLVVVDLVMPRLSGIELCRMLQAIPEMEDVGVVLVSASMSKKAEAEALQAGAQAAWPKPVPIKKILELLNISVAHEK
jgi:excisionase family DNA binding protein